MAAITALTEDFEGGTAGTALSTTNTFFTSVAPFNKPTFVADAVQGLLAFTPVVNAAAVNRVDITPAATVWLSFYIKITADTTANNGFLTFYDGDSNKVGDVRILPGRLLQLRSVNTEAWVSDPLDLNVWYRVAVKVAPTSTGTGTLACKVYSGIVAHHYLTASQESGDVTATALAATVSNFRFGTASADATFDYRLDRVRGDNAVEPFPMTFRYRVSSTLARVGMYRARV